MLSNIVKLSVLSGAEFKGVPNSRMALQNNHRDERVENFNLKSIVLLESQKFLNFKWFSNLDSKFGTDRKKLRHSKFELRAQN